MPVGRMRRRIFCSGSLHSFREALKNEAGRVPSSAISGRPCFTAVKEPTCSGEGATKEAALWPRNPMRR